MLKKYMPILPFALILLFILIVYISGAYHYFTFGMIQDEHFKWQSFVHENPVLSALCFIGIYTASVILVVPDSTFLTLLGGFLFPLPLAVAYSCIAETLGGLMFFLSARLAFLHTVQMKKKGYLHEMKVKFHDDQACYLLFLRFSHLLPFWVINLGAGLFHVRTWTFIWTTLIGVFPLTFFLAEGGASLSKYFQTHTHFYLKEVFTPQLKLSLIGLGIVALLPILYKNFKKKSR
jgi:uncharacterized membrane protein YdjX (TVP38/TMEM64 family)